MHPLGIGVWDASRLIDPRNPPTSPGGWVYPLMDGHPHRCSTDFEQTLLGGHLTRRGVGCPWVHKSPWVRVHSWWDRWANPGLEGGVGCNPRVTFDGKVRNLGQRTFCPRPQIRFPPTWGPPSQHLFDSRQSPPPLKTWRRLRLDPRHQCLSEVEVG